MLVLISIKNTGLSIGQFLICSAAALAVMPMPTLSLEWLAALWARVSTSSFASFVRVNGMPSSSSPAQISDKCAGFAFVSYMCTVGLLFGWFTDGLTSGLISANLKGWSAFTRSIKT